MGWFSPKLPDYDIGAWERAPFPDRVRQVCAAWTVDGYGTPLSIHAAYALKIALLYVGGWLLFCALGGLPLGQIGGWWASDVAFAKAIFWTMLFEGLGWGCGSGPLTGRYLPPVGGAPWFLTPGTTKLPLWRELPLLGGHQRTVVDVLLYLATCGTLLSGLVGTPGPGHYASLLVLLPLMGLLDRTLFLVFRSEHYLSVVVCLLFAEDWIAGSKWVWLAIWLWAATSKANHHFPSVIGVMTSNAPWTRFVPGLRERMVRSWPDDLRPSTEAASLAHFGTVTEVVVPLMLVFGDGGPMTAIGLVAITAFHLFILSNVPMGVPLEWNVIMIYGAWVLYGVHADVPMTAGSPLLVAWLVGMHLVLPVAGNLFPDRVSFLLGMRYYAGNWAYNVWLFAPGAHGRLFAGVKTWSPPHRAQLAPFYDEDTITALLSKVVAFRFMHLQGRVLREVLPLAVDDLDDRVWLDGEMVAGVVVGWNFGEGHLSRHELLEAVQAQCDFAPGELRVVMVEGQPIHRQTLAWRVVDAATGEIARGEVSVSRLREGQPWEIAPGPAPAVHSAPSPEAP